MKIPCISHYISNCSQRVIGYSKLSRSLRPHFYAIERPILETLRTNGLRNCLTESRRASISVMRTEQGHGWAPWNCEAVWKQGNRVHTLRCTTPSLHVGSRKLAAWAACNKTFFPGLHPSQSILCGGLHGPLPAHACHHLRAHKCEDVCHLDCTTPMTRHAAIVAFEDCRSR